MRIRKRPSLQSLCSLFLNSDPPKESDRSKANAVEAPDPQLFKDEKLQVADASTPSPSQTLDAQISSNHNRRSRSRGSVEPVIMEGSRCSRVNGRGWRCCQQTLVGYSLCEHHLGKGRLRSIGGSSRGSKKVKGKSGRENEEIGAMKARSISSLLDETDHAAAAIISSLANGASN